MKEEQLIKLMDAYMKNDGYYMKPIFKENTDNFFIAKGSATAENIRESFNVVADALGQKEEKEIQLFTGKPKVECAVCADVPNMTEVIPDNMRDI